MLPSKPPPSGAWGALGAAPLAWRAIESFAAGHLWWALLWTYLAGVALLVIAWFVAGLYNTPR